MGISFEDYKKILGMRVKQAREMAKFETRDKFTAHFPEWSKSRLANYENGVSAPNYLEILKISKVTGTNPCWIAFGIGSIRSHSRDIQAIRYQNLTHLCEKLSSDKFKELRVAIKIKPSGLKNHLKNPFLKLTDSLCRKIESHLGKVKGYMDEQQIDNDGMCDFFPDDLRKMMMIYSSLDEKNKTMLLNIGNMFDDASS